MSSKLIFTTVIAIAACVSPATWPNAKSVPGKASFAAVGNESLSPKDRLEVFETIWKGINERFYDPHFNGLDWPAVHQRYQPLVDAVKTDREFWDLMSKMALELHDVHTRVFSPEQWERIKKQQGIAIGFNVEEIEGQPVITGVRADTDAARAGLEPGMIVQAVDGQPFAERLAKAEQEIGLRSTERNTRRNAYAEILSGDPDSLLKLSLQRADDSTFEVTIKRQAVTNPARVIARELPSGFAYIRLTQFMPPAAKDFKEALSKFSNAPGLILDLRANGGGDQDELEPIAGSFFNAKTLFVRSTSRTGKPLKFYGGFYTVPPELYVGQKGGQIYSGPVVVLVDVRSASTTEMFAAGMQETGRAKIIGEQTCGCVVGVHGHQNLKGGGIYTIAEVIWLTASGRKLEGEGVVPDLKVSSTISDLRQKRNPVIDEAEKTLRAMSHAEQTLSKKQ